MSRERHISPLAAEHRVLFVMARDERLHSLFASVERSGVAASIDLADDLVDALRYVACRPPEVLVLDFAIDRALAPSLIWQMMSTARSSLALIFDDVPQPAGGVYRVWPWADAWTVLKCGLEQRLGNRRLVSGCA